MGPITSFLLTLTASALGLALAGEVGLHLGQRRRQSSDAEGRSQVSMVEGALLGLLALLLGFTFSMAAGRYDARQELVLREANAIGTAVLRSDFLAPNDRAPFRKLLLAYTENRLEYAQAGVDDEKIERAQRTADGLQAELWGMAVAEARSRPTPTSGLLVAALNELFDLREARMAALHNRVPVTIWLVLYGVALLSAGALGLGSGLAGRRLLLSTGLVPVLLALILTLLIDLDHPRKGLILVSQESMLRVRDSLK